MPLHLATTVLNYCTGTHQGVGHKARRPGTCSRDWCPMKKGKAQRDAQSGVLKSEQHAPGFSKSAAFICVSSSIAAVFAVSWHFMGRESKSEKALRARIAALEDVLVHREQRIAQIQETCSRDSIGPDSSLKAAAGIAAALSADCNVVHEISLHAVAPAEFRPLNLTYGLPSSVRCPIVIRGAVTFCQGSKLAESWTWNRVRRAGPQRQVTFDASAEPGFTYWSNVTMMAELVNLRGLRTQNFKTVTTSIDRFVDATESVDDEYGPFVRYGAPLRKFSASMANELITAQTSSIAHDAAGPLGRLAPLPPDRTDFGEREITLFLAAAGVTSTAHYDNSANMHMLLSGRKRFRLRKPLLARDTLVTWPDTHPNARQLQTPVAQDDDTFTTVELEAGDGLFVPAGWIHEVTALERSIALSLLAHNFEYGDFERFGTQDRLQMIPFLARLQGAIDPARLSKVFKVFVISLLARLEIPELMRTLLSMYSAETRAEFGLPPAATWPFGCHAADASDAAIVREGAEVVALRFLKYHATLRPRYVTVFLENILGVMASFLNLPTKEATYAAWLDFATACLIPPSP